MSLGTMLAIILVVGCAHTDRSGRPYSSALVLANLGGDELGDSRHEPYLENAVCERLKRSGVYCKRGIDVFPRGYPESRAALRAGTQASGAEVLLVIREISSSLYLLHSLELSNHVRSEVTVREDGVSGGSSLKEQLESLAEKVVGQLRRVGMFSMQADWKQ